MATVTKENEGNEADAPDEEPREPKASKKSGKNGGDKDEVRELEVARRSEPRSGPGFFTIYKKGQGYWTRMGTALSAAFLALLTGDFVYTQMNAIPYGKDAHGDPLYIPKQISASVAVFILFAIIFFAWRMMNKPSHVDFLIATDSEMKKVNWTTKAELIGRASCRERV